MKYELQEFKSMVDAIHESDGFETWMTEQRNPIENMALEAGRICQKFKDISSEKDAVLFTKYFHQHQHALVVMADQVYAFLKQHSNDDDDQEDSENEGELSLQRLYNALVSILQFMQTQLKIFLKTDGKYQAALSDNINTMKNEIIFFIEKSCWKEDKCDHCTHLITVKVEDKQPNEKYLLRLYFVLKVQKEY